MNERIQDLINQSWQTVEGPPREGMEDIRQALMEDLNPVFLEFARLMLQEYEDLLPEYCPWSKAKESGPMEGWHVVFVARKHFGVEE